MVAPACPAASVDYLCRRAIEHTFVARLHGQQIVSVVAIADHEPGGIGHIYVGRVVRLVDGLEAAFVDIGGPRPAFLTVDDVAPVHARAPGRGASRSRIRAALTEGMWLLVQIRRASHGDKGARVTTRVSLPGRFVVATLDAPQVTQSQRLVPSASAEQALEALQPLAQAHQIHFVVRTAAGEASVGDIIEEATLLAAKLTGFRSTQEHSRKVAWLSGDRPAAAAALLEAGIGPDTTVYADDPSLRARLLASCQPTGETGAPRVLPMASWRGAQSQQAFCQALQKALSTRVYLPSGGTLIIERTEAMWTIDVNSGQAIGHSKSSGKNAARAPGRREALHALNLEAAHVAGEQIVLRNLGGLLVLDCVEGGTPEDHRAVIDVLKKALQKDRRRFYVAGQSELGLVSLTRTQRDRPLGDALLEACDRCHSPRQQPAAWYVATRALWAADAWLASRRSPMVLVQCATAVATALWQGGDAWLHAIGDAHQTTLVPIARTDWPLGRYELIDTGAPGDVQSEQIFGS